MTLDLVASLTAEQRDRIRAIAAAERVDSGRHPLGESARAALNRRGPSVLRQWLWHDPELQGYVCLTESGSGRVHELTADPARPTATHAMLAALLDQVPGGALWAHGDRAQARIAAALTGLRIERELLIMSRSLVPPPVVRPVPPLVTIRPFDPATDVDGWLRVNAEAFGGLLDQAAVDRTGLEQKLAARWYDPAGFLVAEKDLEIVGFHWTKVDPEDMGRDRSGEVYVIAVRPDQRGTGLAGALLDAGLTHLVATGMRNAHLYVEADNDPAVALYRRAGFDVIDTDRQYVW